MKITVRSFTGLRPQSAADLLAVGEATEAVDTDFEAGDLAPLAAVSAAVTTLTSATPLKTVYRFGQSTTSETQFWFQSTNAANFVKGPVDGDTEERTYFTGHLAYPAKTKSDIATTAAPYPTTSQPLGIAKPATAPTVAVTGTATDAASAAEAVVYVVTFVTLWNEEGPPSSASTVASWRVGQSLSLTAIPTSGAASYPGNTHRAQPYLAKRLYRSATGSTGAAKFLFVAEIAVAATTYTDTAATADLGESLRSRFWLEPPETMLGLSQMANGVLAGYTGNTLCFSEPFVPYAWPVRYQQSTDAPINAIAAFGQSLLVSTTRSLYVFSGIDPSQISSERLSVAQTCVSARSMVEMSGGVIFAAPDGLAYVGPGGFRLLTEGLFTRAQWQAYKPDSMHAYEVDGRYVVFYDTGSVQKGLVFKFGDKPEFYETSVYATAGFRDRARDALYLCINGTGSNREIRKWAAGSGGTMTWASGEMLVPSAVNIGAARIQHTGVVSFTLIGDGVTVYGPATLTTQFGFKLPAGYRAERFKVRLTGTGRVKRVELADSMKALAGE